jgi:hypothetical protein
MALAVGGLWKNIFSRKIITYEGRRYHFFFDFL